MHPNELTIETDLVRELLATQFPQWANLPIKPISSAGTDNALFKLGTDMVVRLPRLARAAPSIEKEAEWLPKLAPHLPLAIPTVLAKGKPSANFPFSWLVCSWLEGHNARTHPPDMAQAARDIGTFITAMHTIDTTNAPTSKRGCPLRERDPVTRVALEKLHGIIEVEHATAVWEKALAEPAWQGKPVWIHADLHPENILVHNGTVSAIIDFGMCGIGDPAVDMMVAWTLFDAATRTLFRETVAVDDATWERGRGWALTFGVVALPYYKDTNPILAGIAQQTIEEIFDHRKQ